MFFMTIKAVLPSSRYTGPPIHRSGELEQTFLWGYLKAQVFTHTLLDINSIKNAIIQEMANVKQDTAMP
jgi:hypothetical protein